ncbi:MAG: acetate--CoA ligase [SAR202 cluster bacterium Io17-Chloro-G3]|nr:MAG: acetate--CoA ligase [SAR202 cluster bacterium Io17-Chloro-G3]
MTTEGLKVIGKPPISEFKVKPNLTDYEETCRNFKFTDVYKELDWLPDGGLNKAYECIDRHANGSNADKLAMVWEGKNGEREDYTFSDMKRETNKFANVLRGLGVERGDRVFLFLERIPEQYIAVFGVLKAGGVCGPLFSAFGPDPVRDRLLDSGAKVLITTPELRKKISHIFQDLPDLEHIIVVNKLGREEAPVESSDLRYEDLMDTASEEFEIDNTSMYDYSIMHYTSGTTGKPKGAVHRHLAIVQQYLTGKWVLDLHPDDIYWCTADPGWVTGTSYGMLAPWSNGVTQLIYEGGLRASTWYELIQRHKVTVWYTAPTAVRLLMRSGTRVTSQYDLSSLRYINSVGEPLNPEAIVWGMEAFGQAIHDNWWQTETGAIMIANYPFQEVRLGSMGRPLPGIEVGILDEHYTEVPPGTRGYLAVRPGWPSMMHQYWQAPERYNSRFMKGWYITGDEAMMDQDGFYWFVGRADDVINTAGHLVGPFEVESALIEHPAVAEAGVIGKPDPIAMEVVKAFVALNEGVEPTEKLRQEIMRFARDKLAAGVAPREIDFIPTLPKTRSGKIMRRLLKARELGLPEGDTSTLEEEE